LNIVDFRPKKRSKWRIRLGTVYYTWKRYVTWYGDGKKYANKQEVDTLPHLIFSHQTVLLRQLKNVDMWYQHNKIINLKLAVKELNGLILKPGETFSFWRNVGKPTKKKGYVDGMVLHYGKVYAGIGGGLCQLTNLIYWMTIHTPLTITERYRHSFDVFPDSNRTQPFGSGATCHYNYFDLQFQNNTPYTYQLKLIVTDSHLVGQWYCSEAALQTYEVYEKEHRISMAYWGDYIRQNSIYRKVLNRQGIEIDDEFVAENIAIMMYQPLLEATYTET
ncbi:MAG: VanW family protein, partial [Bacillaceae bacterium]